MAFTEYETPQDFFDTLNREFHFTLDVCATKENAKCELYYSPEQNSLERDWLGHVCWMNPPYDKSIGVWIKKAYETAQQGGLVVALIQSRSTDTKVFHQYVMKASEIRFIKDRLHFGRLLSVELPMAYIGRKRKEREQAGECCASISGNLKKSLTG